MGVNVKKDGSMIDLILSAKNVISNVNLVQDLLTAV